MVGMTNINLGILAHVDAGKTTLTESLLYKAGVIENPGRVDHGKAYLDTDDMEKERGITIFSKQAIFKIDTQEYTILDTPGHVDFSAEMERTLMVMDYAVLLVSAPEGIQGHTLTLWRLLEAYDIPTFIFINKTDQLSGSIDLVVTQLKNKFSENCVSFMPTDKKDFFDDIALINEAYLNQYLDTGTIDLNHISKGIQERAVFPIFWGSALKLDGIDFFMKGINQFMLPPLYPDTFGGRIFKITRDENGQRLAHMKITGHILQVKDELVHDRWQAKINQIRIYSGVKYETRSYVPAGTVCAVTGLDEAVAGEGVGFETNSDAGVLEPVLQYQVIFPNGESSRMVLPLLKQLEEEFPELGIIWHEALQEIQIKLMGDVQTEVLKRIILEKFDLEVDFDTGKILYKETIGNTVEGVGHFEPLRHYAEVHLLLAPGEPGSGLVFDSIAKEDDLPSNWQNLILTHLEEKPHKGVLTGSEITDMKIRLVSGRGHNKHTEGGDFREATYRAVRQGLMEAHSILLEPFYALDLEIPEEMVGKAMTDIETKKGTSEIVSSVGGMVRIQGRAPVSTLRNYHQEVRAYSRGKGRLTLNYSGYGICHNQEEIIEQIGYDPELDTENPTGSVFCTKGSGYLVSWDAVKAHMHLEPWLKQKKESINDKETQSQFTNSDLSLEEIDEILNRATGANQGRKSMWRKRHSQRIYQTGHVFDGQWHEKSITKKEGYLLVDGYNIIFAWDELNVLAKDNFEAARVKLLELLDHYQSAGDVKIMVVFDAYKVEKRHAEIEHYKNIRVVFTGEAQTADQYIEKFAHTNKNIYEITVATSDGLQQMIIRGAGSRLLSARELKEKLDQYMEEVNKTINSLRKENQLQTEKIINPNVAKILDKKDS